MSTDYSDIKNWIERHPQSFGFIPTPPELITSLKSDYKNIPEAYVDFLAEFGGMSIGNSFMIYRSIVSPYTVFRERAKEFGNVLLIGDDYAGLSIGFDVGANWRLVSIDSETDEVDDLTLYLDKEEEIVANSFEEWIKCLIPYLLSD
ncbi:hypothetical protein Pla110_04550 [Polystyrenella longa]|uniref:SMI1 / KNR4 family protein n=1 Tax=Polystyrenella longa TaxID=2528007 RepID=A0A518CHQ8_9PLAN|nr:hypothetical protein [Polystyrenella longa]QDU78751.1 hypothetical protein Pla110_04550 [Polystyrenella longa]